MKFSQRYGHVEVKNKLQIESVDEDLKNSIWNALNVVYWDNVKYVDIDFSQIKILDDRYNSDMKLFVRRLYFNFYKIPLNNVSYEWNKEIKKIADFYFVKAKWYGIYDFIEFIVNNYPNENANTSFVELCNSVLEKEMSGYRFVDKIITLITDKNEIKAIEESALVKIDSVRNHMIRSLELLSDRKNPDYRNSIKESISAVESLVSIVTGNDKGTLGQLIKQLDEKIEIHESLKQAFSKLYGYSSDESGIRHFLKDKEKVDFEDAKYMLVSCSAFINYVNGKLK